MPLPWYREYFGEDYFRIYGPLLPSERTAREVEGIVQLLNLPDGAQLLDLCCGHGRHAIPLAERGYRVTGLDLSQTFLRRAQQEAVECGVSVNWVRADMRSVPFEGCFDAVLNLFTAFGYLESDAEDQKVLEQVYRALKPGGRFLMELLHREWLMRNLQPAGIRRHEDGLIVLEERQFDLLTSRTEVRVTLLEAGGQRREYRHAVRAYTLTELAGMLERAGLPLEGSFSGLAEREPLTLNSHRLVVVGRKG